MSRKSAQKSTGRSPGGLLGIWAGQHARAFLASLGQLLQNPLGNLFSIAVIGVSLALPAGFYLVLDNSRNVLENWDGNLQIALYLHQDVRPDRLEALRTELGTWTGIEEITLITRDQALDEYRRLSGFAEALDALEDNPLPDMFLIRPRLEMLDNATANQLMTRLSELPEVESTQLDRQWVRRLFVILELLHRAVIIFTTLLSLAVALIIGNTIRLSVNNKRAEIEINKLFGATNAFIKRPFLYGGVLYGLAGSLLAWLLLLLSGWLLTEPVTRLAQLYGSSYRLSGLGLNGVLILLLAGAALGLIGAWLAVSRHIREMEPR